MMGEKLPVVSVFGVGNVSLRSAGPVPQFETDRLDCRCHLTDDDLYSVLAKDRPQAVVSFGRRTDFSELAASPFEIRRMWVHFDDTSELDKVGAEVFRVFVQNALVEKNDVPLVTVFTPAYKTGEKVMRPLLSLQAQTHVDWEWVVMDDSDDGGETFKMLSGLAEKDFRMRVYKADRHSGIIGRVKREACQLGRGQYLVELDHDDELTPDALELVVAAFEANKEAGFVYTDFAECFEDGSPVTYGQDPGAKPPFSDWGLGYGSYRDETVGGQLFKVANSPNINAKTIRHIVAAPNHIRAWRASLYRRIGGHKELVHVADDYELMVRTFLHTRMVRVPRMCYVQYRNYDTGNTHRERNQEIQRLVRYFSQFYDRPIHERLLELGVDDFVWRDGESSFVRMMSVVNPAVESHCTILADV
jgi:glycosyltransferase involved in cell wall biosynthesis